MAYAPLTTVANISSYFQGMTFDSGSTITDTEVSRWIDQATAIIYGAISQVYTIPSTGITDATDILQLAVLAEMYVVVQIKTATGAVQTRAIRDGNMAVIEPSLKYFWDMLDGYKCLEYRLVNTAFATGTTQYSSYSYTQMNSITPEAKKGVDQW